MDKPQTTIVLLAIAVPLFLLSLILERREPELPPAPAKVTSKAAAPPASVPAAPAAPEWVVKVDGWSIGFHDVVPKRVPPMRDRTNSTILPVRPAAAFQSDFDALIAYHAESAGFDWRLVSALIAVESAFESDAESEAGAVGLMQIRKIAADDVGEELVWDPDGNIRTGVQYLKRLEAMYPEAEGRERLAMVLAAYNMGPGHMEDAQSLARRFGYDPNHWYGSLEHLIPLMEQPAIYESLPNGYARGRDVVDYVGRILERFDQHRVASYAGKTS